MRIGVKRAAAALSVACVIALSPSAGAGPVPGIVASVGTAAPSPLTEVHWRGRGAGVAAGIAAGLITGAIVAGAAGPYYSGYYGAGPYYGGGYYYGPTYYDPPSYYYAPRYYRYRAPVYIEPGPVYVAPPPYYSPYGPARRCWVTTDSHRGYGYWRPC